MTKPEPDKDAEEKRRAILGAIKAFDLPPLKEGTPAFLSLEASLLQHGCINPIVMKGDEVISGRARKAICDKHGIKYEIVQVDDLSDADLISLQNDLNFVGRHIDNDTKKEYAKHLLRCSQGTLSNRAVGSMAALDKKIVQVIRDELEASGETPHTTIRYSRDWRSQDVSDKEERKVIPFDESDKQPDDGDERANETKEEETVSLEKTTQIEGRQDEKDDAGHDGQLEQSQDEDEEDDKYDQESLRNDLEIVDDDLQETLKLMSGDIGLFPDPEAIVKQIDKCIGLLDELKAKLPSQIEVA